MTIRSQRSTMPHDPSPHRSPEQPIAIVGLACRLPQAPDPEAFWRLLREGRSAVTEVPPGRWTTAAARPRHGAFLDDVAGFDADFFDISPLEASTMDPQQRLALELSWEVLEDAGVVPGRLDGTRTGVFIGATWDDYAHLALRLGTDRLTAHSMTGLHRSIIANRVSHMFGLRGPSLTVDTGQSSSLVAVHLAAESLRRGECVLALAGGVNLALLAETGVSAERFGGLSPDGRCHTFDARANGYVRGEGGGVVLLKPLDAALADGDDIYCVVRGSAVNNDGATRTLAQPSAEAQQDVLRLAYRAAGVGTDEVQYVELHGTGTPAGDPVEAAALGAVLGVGRADDAPLLVGSAKTNVGHLEGAAGIVGLIKVAMSIAHRTLPASLNFATPNPRIPLDELRLAVHTKCGDWPRPDRSLVAGVSAFGMGGTNCHVVLAAPPHDRRRTSTAHPTVGITAWPVSAHDADALRASAARLLDTVQAHPEFSDADIGHSLAVTRAALEHRAVVIGRDRAELETGLGALAAGQPAACLVPPAPSAAGRIVFVFSGQGTQWPGMATTLLATTPVFARRIDECAAALAPHVDWSLRDVLAGTPGAPSLDRVDVVQPALFAVMVSLAEVWRSLGVAPDAVAGHSQGEIAAACVAGGLSLVDAARVVAVRARAVASLAGGGSMLSVALPVTRLRALLRERSDGLSVAAVNGPESTVVAGTVADLEELAVRCAADGIRVRRVAVDYAAHSAQVEPLRDGLLRELSTVSARPGRVAFYSSVTGGRLDTRELSAGYWYRNLRQPVALHTVTRALLGQGYRIFVEVSPHPVLTGSVEDTIAQAGPAARGAVAVGSLRRDHGGWRQMLTSAAQVYVRGGAVDWSATYGPAPGRVRLPGYPFQRRRYWLDTPVPGPAPSRTGDLRSLTAAERRGRLLELVRAQTAAVLGHTGPEAVEPTRAFTHLGLESATAIEIRNRLATATGLALPTGLAFDHPTPGDVVEYLLSCLDERDAVVLPDQGSEAREIEERIFSATHEELFALIDEERGRADLALEGRA